MSGKIVMSLFLAAALIFGGLLYYFQVYAYYAPTEKLSSITVGEAEIAVGFYEGIDSTTSPNKLRACFEVAPEAFDGLVPVDDADPLIAPSWFECFDAEGIAKDLEAGRARAYIAADETPEGAVGYEILRFVAVYPDGRAFLWRHYREAE
ncbi:MAG: DUF6446 family protein [Pseudomonadota bacterium]